MAKTLDAKIYSNVTALCQAGNEYLNNDQYDMALEQYRIALDLLPAPKHEWEAATWIFTALGDAYFFKSDFQKSLESLLNAIQCPDAIENPFIHLRLGQSYFELGNLQKSADELTRAYMGGGREIFKAEPPKYFELLKKVLKPPVGQSEL